MAGPPQVVREVDLRRPLLAVGRHVAGGNADEVLRKPHDLIAVGVQRLAGGGSRIHGVSSGPHSSMISRR